MQPPRTQAVIALTEKNVGLAIFLALFFGPLGMFYSTIAGAIVMFCVSLVFGCITLGYGLILTQPVCAIWAALAAHSYNTKLLSRAA